MREWQAVAQAGDRQAWSASNAFRKGRNHGCFKHFILAMNRSIGTQPSGC
jgi:hypothetical protein